MQEKKEKAQEDISQILKRIEEYREKIGLNVSQFCAKIGYPQGSYYSAKNRGTRVGEDLILAVADKTDINPFWLLTGEGIMRNVRLVRTDDGVTNLIVAKPIYTDLSGFTDVSGHTTPGVPLPGDAALEGLREELTVQVERWKTEAQVAVAKAEERERTIKALEEQITRMDAQVADARQTVNWTRAQVAEIKAAPPANLSHQEQSLIESFRMLEDVSRRHILDSAKALAERHEAQRTQHKSAREKRPT